MSSNNQLDIQVCNLVWYEVINITIHLSIGTCHVGLIDKAVDDPILLCLRGPLSKAQLDLLLA